MKTTTELTVNINPSTRRAWLRQGIVSVVATVPFVSSTKSAVAYERRDVGGAGRSAETAAFNEQAYETNNRLEREGFKLETQQEQQASLSAALAEYAYAPSTTGSTNTGTSSKKNKGSTTSNASARAGASSVKSSSN
jgi:hypothetical protein